MRLYRLNTLGDTNDETLCFFDSTNDYLEMADVPMSQGKSAAKLFPKDARFYMTEENPGIKLCSLIGNTSSLLLVSSKVREVVLSHCGEKVEAFPVAIYDHRRRLASEDYCILNPLGTYACLDLQKSDVVWSDDQPPEVLDVYAHVIDRSRSDAAPPLFRLDVAPMTQLINNDLAKALNAIGITNLTWTKLKFGDE